MVCSLIRVIIIKYLLLSTHFFKSKFMTRYYAANLNTQFLFLVFMCSCLLADGLQQSKSMLKKMHELIATRPATHIQGCLIRVIRAKASWLGVKKLK